MSRSEKTEYNENDSFGLIAISIPDCRMNKLSSVETAPNSVGGIHKKTAAQHFGQLSFRVSRVWRCCARQTYRKAVGIGLSRQSVKG